VPFEEIQKYFNVEVPCDEFMLKRPATRLELMTSYILAIVISISMDDTRVAYEMRKDPPSMIGPSRHYSLQA
jgi:hypothetical protein